MSQINTSQLVRVKVQPRHFECKIVQFNKLWWRNVLVIHQNDIKLHRGNTVFQRKWILEDDRTQICFNSRKLKRNQLLLEGFSIKMSACVLYSLILSWACSFGHSWTHIISSSEGKRLLWLDKQSCEAQWVVSVTWGDTEDQSRHADTSACSDWLYVERRCVPWLKQPWNGANQPVWGYRHKNRMIQHRNWIWTGFHYNLFGISVSRATDLLHIYSSLCIFWKTFSASE